METGSLWDATLPDSERAVADPLPGSTHCDIAIVGAGLTGLWAAYYLSGRLPDRQILILDRADIGAGASGRNGGWASALFPVGPDALTRRWGAATAVAVQRAMHATLDEIEQVLRVEGIDAGFARGGSLTGARTAAQEDRIGHEAASYARLGFGADDYRLLSADEAREICAMTDLRGGFFTPHCAAMHPARLTHGLARVVQARGVQIHAPVTATRISPGRITTDQGEVHAPIILRATEGYTPRLAGARREVIPLYSMMVGTAPLPASTWEQIGLTERSTFADGRHMIIYGQRTADDRLAFGGRGAPYHFASAVQDNFDTDEQVRAMLTATLCELFPVLRPEQITHHWGGPLAAPRDWMPHVRMDATTGLASAGGYVGDGVSTTNLAGRTLAALIAPDGSAADAALTSLPWVGHRSRRWEPEPLRWAGINLGRWAAGRADKVEARRDAPSALWTTALRTLLGR